jgi:hypothetical protein
MREAGQGKVHGLIQQYLAIGVGNVIVAAQDMGDAHFVIIRHHGHVVDRHAIRAQHDHVVQFGYLNRRGSLDHIIVYDFAVGRKFEADHMAGSGA